MGETLLPVGTSYAEVYPRFRWQLPTTFNIGADVCDRHADDPSRLAMIYEDDTGQVSTHTFAEFRARSNQLAHALIRLGSPVETVSASSCRSVRRQPWPIWLRTSLAPLRCPLDVVWSGSTRLPAARRRSPGGGDGRREPRPRARGARCAPGTAACHLC